MNKTWPISSSKCVRDSAEMFARCVRSTPLGVGPDVRSMRVAPFGQRNEIQLVGSESSHPNKKKYEDEIV